MTLLGLDTSNLNGDPTTYSAQPVYQGAQYIIAQAIPRGPTSTERQLTYARDQGKMLGAYSWLWDTPSYRLDPDVYTDQMIRWTEVPQDVELNMRPWIDVEDNISSGWQSVSVTQRKRNLLAALAAGDDFASSRNLPPAGIYTSVYYINLLFKGWMPEGRLLWLASYGITPGSIITGRVVGHQYSSTPLDQDVFLESEFVRHAPMTLNVGQGLQDAMTAAGDHPISDEFTERVNSDNTVIQAAYGLKGKYRATNATGQWEHAGPFSA